MNARPPTGPGWLRRARPLLGTLVEVGLPAPTDEANLAFDAAFAQAEAAQACLSRYDEASDVARFNRLAAGLFLEMRPATRTVLHAAAELRDATDALFDVTLGTAPHGWASDGARLRKLDAAASIDLGGIGKGHAVDLAVQALVERGVAAGWVNAGGDLRCFGDVELPIWLRDEATGGARPFATLHDGAFATSHFGAETRSRLAHAARAGAGRHVSVAAPSCLWADALTKVVAESCDAAHPALTPHAATAWIHRG